MILLGSKGGKGGGSSGGGGKEAKNTLRSRTFVQALDLVTEGDIEGLVAGEQSIILNGTPLQNADGTYNFTNFEWAFTPGTHDQPALVGFPSATEEFPVGLAIKKDNPFEFTVSDVETDLIRVRMAIPALSYTDTSNGNTLGTTLQYKLEVRQLPFGSFQPVLVGRAFEVTGNPFTGGYIGKAVINLTPGSVTETYSTGKNGNDRTRTEFKSGTLTLQKKIGAGGAWTTVKQWRYERKKQTLTTTFPCDPSDTVYLQVLVNSDGGLTNYAYSLRVEKQVQDAVVTLNDKTTSRYERQHQFSPSALVGAGPWQVRVTRITNDSNNVYLQNSLEIASYAQVNTEKLRYPYCAMMALRMDTEQFSSEPTRGYHMKLKIVRVPSNYDPASRTYTGMWDGTFKWAWTNNPVWVFYDLALNKRFGAGRKVQEYMLDKAWLYKMAQYCDEMVADGYGGSEPRFTCNVYLQKATEASKLLTDLASVFHGMAFYSANRILVVQDAPRDIKYLYTNANVKDGRFNYSTSPHETRFNTYLVSWNNPANQFKADVEYVSDPDLVKADGRVRSSDTVAFGCTSRGQARRTGRYMIYSNYYAGRFVRFTAGADGAVPVPGDLVAVQDSLKAGEKRGGRIQAISESAGNHIITLDALINVPVGSLLFVIDPNAGIQSKVVQQVSGKNVTVTGLFSPAPTPDAMYSVDAVDIRQQTFMVLAVEEAGDHEYTLSGMLHLEGKYDYIDDDVDIQLPDTSNLQLALQAPPAPTSPTTADTLYYGPGNTLQTKMMVHWTAPADTYAVRGFQLRYRAPDSPWTELAETKLPGVEILGVVEGTLYEFELHSVNSIGLRSVVPLTFTYTPLGLKAPPADVTGFTYTVDPQLGVRLSWEAVSDLDVSLYEVRRGASWEAGTPVGTAKADNMMAGFALSATLWIKAKDSTDNYSTNAASLSYTLAAPPAANPSAAFSGSSLNLAWDTATGAFGIDYYRVTAPDLLPQLVKGSGLTLAGSWLGAKVFTVEAVDVGGNVGASSDVTATITAPAAPTLSADFEGSSVVLSWGEVAGTLPTTGYIVKRAGVVVDTIQANRWSQNVDWSSGMGFAVAAVDAAGNVGAYASVTATLTLPPAPTVAGNFAAKTLVLGWSAVVGSLSTVEYEITAPGFTTRRVKGTTLTVDVDWLGSRTFTVKAVDTADNLGLGGTFAAVVSVAAAPAVTAQIVADRVVLTWPEIAGTLPTALYRVTKAGVEVGRIQSTVFSEKVDWLGAKNYSVAAIDVNDNLGAAGSVTSTVLAPVAPSVQQEVIDNNVLLRWSDATATLPIDTYEIRRGTDWVTAKVVGKTLSRFSALFESVAGSFTYLVGAYDSAGNLGAIGSVAALVSQPPDYALQLDFNSVLNGTLVNGKLDQADSSLMLPLNLTETFEQHFEQGILASPSAFNDANWARGNTTIVSDTTTAPDGSSRADKLVENGSTAAHTVQQSTSLTLTAGQTVVLAVYAKSAGSGRRISLLGTYAIFGTNSGAVFDVDTGTVVATTGTASGASITSVGGGWYLCQVLLTAGAPGTATFFFSLSNNALVHPSYTGDGVSGVYLWGAQAVSGAVLPPQWFSPAAQVAAGFPYGAQPAASSGYYEETLDYGTVLAATRVTVTPTTQVVAGAPGISTSISVRASTLDAWVDYPNQSSVYATNFRYVKVRVTFNSADGTALAKLSALNVRLDAKLKNDAGSGTAAAGDAGGTTVFFNIPFVDVHSITVTAKGTTPVTVIYDFADVPNPTSFKVLMFNAAGARVSGEFSWSAKGA